MRERKLSLWYYTQNVPITLYNMYVCVFCESLFLFEMFMISKARILLVGDFVNMHKVRGDDEKESEHRRGYFLSLVCTAVINARVITKKKSSP